MIDETRGGGRGHRKGEERGGGETANIMYMVISCGFKMRLRVQGKENETSYVHETDGNG